MLYPKGVMLLRPRLIVPQVSDLSPSLLTEYGIRALLVDLDDTLVASNGTEMAPEARRWVQTLQNCDVPLAILSNGSYSRVRTWSARLGIPGFSLVGKPCAFAFRRGLARLQTPAAHTAMVGDQIFTDVLGANLTGVMPILVTPLSAGKLPHTRLLRRLEQKLLGGYCGCSLDR